MDIAVGQEVAVQTSYSTLFGFVVTKVTPSGQVVATRAGEGPTGAYTKRFDKNGYEMGGASSWRRDRLVVDVAKAKAQARTDKALNEAAKAVCAVTADQKCNKHWGVDGLLKEVKRLEELLAQAREAIEEVGAPYSAVPEGTTLAEG